MKLDNGSITISNRDVHYTLVDSRSDVAWGQFDRWALADVEQPRRGSESWRSIVDNLLIEWGRRPEVIEDDGIEPPAARAIAVASIVASRLRDDKMPPPTNVAPTADGGIAFQYELAGCFLTIEIDPNGDVELRVYRDGDVIRHNLGRPN